MKVIKNFKYTKEHEWIDINTGIIGVTDFAQKELGDVVFIELPNIADSFVQNAVFGTIEAVKTVADLYIPISGKIIDINQKLESNPELINRDPYREGWIIKIEINNNTELESLLDNEQYEKLIS